MPRLLLVLAALRAAAGQDAADAALPELSLARESQVLARTQRASLEAKTSIAQLTGAILKTENQMALAKVKVQALEREEESMKSHATMLSNKVEKMDARKKSHGGVLEKSAIAKSNTVEEQNEMVHEESDLDALKKDIKNKTNFLKSQKAQLGALQRKASDYSDGSRLALKKSNDLQRELKKAKLQLDDAKKNLSLATEAEQVVKNKFNAARRQGEREKTELQAQKEWMEDRQQVDVIYTANASMAAAEEELKDAKQQIKEVRRKSKEQARQHELDLEEKRSQEEARRAATEQAMKQFEDEMPAKLKEHASKVEGDTPDVALALEARTATLRTEQEQEELRPLQQELRSKLDEVELLKSQNEAQRKKIEHSTGSLAAEAQAAKEKMQSHLKKQEGDLSTMKGESKNLLVDSEKREAKIRMKITKMSEDRKEEKKKVHELDQQLMREQKKLRDATKLFDTMKSKEKDEMKKMKSKIEEESEQEEQNAQEEVKNLREEFKQVHEAKNQKVSKLNNQLKELQQRNAKLRGQTQ